MSALQPSQLVEAAFESAVPPEGHRTRSAHQAPAACYWTEDTEIVAPRFTCRKPPPYARPKKSLPTSGRTAAKPLLSAALAKQHASSDNMLIVTYINRIRVDFALAWVRHLVAEKQLHHLVAALDSEALALLETHGVPCYMLNYSHLGGSDTGWGTSAFRALGLVKVQMVLDLAKTGVDVLTVDADALILRDPLPYFRALPRADVLMSSDHLAATNGYGDTGLEGEAAFGSAFNIGFIFIRSKALEFVQEWRDACFAHESSWDQSLFASVLRRGGRNYHRSDRLQPMFRLKSGEQLLAGVLPVSLFAGGHTFFVTRMSHLMHEHPYMVHTTFQ